jgi:hypothetical protein
MSVANRHYLSFVATATLLGLTLCLVETQSLFHFIQWARPTGGSRVPFVLAAIFGLALPMCFLAVAPKQAKIRNVVVPFVGLLLLQILSEAVFAKCFFPSSAFLIAPPYQAFRIVQSAVSWHYLKSSESFLERSLRVLMLLNVLIWMGIFIHTMAWRIPAAIST